MVTDRTELDEQLHGVFADAGVISKEARVHAETSEHLRDLLAADHRYVFTLIHKFRLRDGEASMPVLSDRNDVIVITDEAHRSQYDTLALNMRTALPKAAFMGFIGTPLVVGEELTRQEFGDYVSGPRVIDSHVRERMQGVLQDIQSGEFAKLWIAEMDSGEAALRGHRAEAANQLIEQVGEELRALMRREDTSAVR